MRNRSSRLVGVIALLGATIFATSPSSVEAASYKNVTFVADNTTRYLTTYFTDTHPNNASCQDDSVVGAIRFTYKASGSTFSITKTELYVSSTQKNSAAITFASFRFNSTQVTQGPVTMTPERVAPGKWGTLVRWNGSSWVNEVMNGQLGVSQYSFSIAKNDPNMGWDHYLCAGVVYGGIFKA